MIAIPACSRHPTIPGGCSSPAVETSRQVRDFNGYNPDLDYYDIYYKTTSSVLGLETASETLIPLTPPDNAQRDIAALQTQDGIIRVFTSTGLGEGTDRSIYHYAYDGSWHGPTPVPDTDYAAHISVLEDRGQDLGLL